VEFVLLTENPCLAGGVFLTAEARRSRREFDFLCVSAVSFLVRLPLYKIRGKVFMQVTEMKRTFLWMYRDGQRAIAAARPLIQTRAARHKFHE
jgi:hypothetical protein